MNIGESMKAVRRAAKVPVFIAADQLGIYFGHLINIENGRVQPTVDEIARFNEFWGVDVRIDANEEQTR